MSSLPHDLFYTKNHEWVRRLSGGGVEIGITDHAQSALGDLVFVEVPEAGRRLLAGAAVAVVESVKAASDVYSPFSGIVSESNPELANRPELLNQDPYGGGWLLRMTTDVSAAAEPLMSPEEYTRFLATVAA